MPTLLSEFLTSGAPDFDEVDVADQAYFRERFRNRVHELMLDTFEQRELVGLTRSDLAKLMKRRPEQISRLLGAPGNLTLETVSDFFLALGLELDCATVSIKQARVHNHEHELAAFAPTHQIQRAGMGFVLHTGSVAPTNVPSIRSIRLTETIEK